MTPLTPEEQKAIAALDRLVKKWPETLWLFSGNGTLCVMRCDTDGSRAMTAEGNCDPDFVVAEIDIPNDGGGW